MFDIEYKGGNCVVITTKKTTLVFDPKLSVVGLKDISIPNSVELATEDRLATNGNQAKLHIQSAGEYGVGDCDIKAIAAVRKIDSDESIKNSMIYTVSVADNKVAILGNINDNLTDEQLESIGVIDILITPVGGNGLTLDSHAAARLTKKIDTKVVIPIHYDDPKLKYEVPQDSLDSFVEELKVDKEDAIIKYKVKPNMTYPSSLTIIELQKS